MYRDFITLYGNDVRPGLEALAFGEFARRARGQQLRLIIPNFVEQLFPIVKTMPEMMTSLRKKVLRAYASHSRTNRRSLGGDNLEPLLDSFWRLAEERSALFHEWKIQNQNDNLYPTTEYEQPNVALWRLHLEYVTSDPDVDAIFALAALIGAVEAGATAISKELSKPLFAYYNKDIKLVKSHVMHRCSCPPVHLIHIYKCIGLSVVEYEYVIKETLNTIRMMRNALDDITDLTLSTRMLRPNCHRWFPKSA